MEIKVRNIDPSTVASLDEKASARGLSRNEYLKRMLEKMATVDSWYEERNEYESLVKSLEGIIRHNSQELQRYKDSMDRIEKYMSDIAERN